MTSHLWLGLILKAARHKSNAFLSGYRLSLLLAGSLTNFLYSANSDGEQSISRTSKSAGCNFMGNLSRATQGFVYIFESLIVTVSSKVS